jgi:pantoate--beta-alanine ligase
MQVLETIAALRSARKSITGTVGLVPTMGYLHDGHMSLVDYARRENDVVVATIFVNPTQFAEGDDLETYPRDLPRDFGMLEAAGVDFVFTPTPALMYPDGYQTYVTVEKVTQRLEGAQRDGHFRGVATVVSKLFNLIQPDIAYFGQKDAQQVVAIRQFVRDLNFPLDIAICPIVREDDGLALSSRNVYLSSDEREVATVLYQAIRMVGTAYENGERNPIQLRRIAEDVINAEHLADLNYVSVANPVTLDEVTETTESPLLLSMAAKIGHPRLLDNCLLPLTLNNREDASRVLGIE